MNDNSQVQTTIESSWQSTWTIPLWFWLTFFVSASLFVFFVYRSERGSASHWSRALLAALRLALMTCVVWMLAGWNYVQYKAQLPELLVVVDTSSSMGTRETAMDSATGFDPSESPSRLEQVQQVLREQLAGNALDRLQERYQVRWFAIDEDTRPLSEFQDLANLKAQGPQSKLGEGLSNLIGSQAGRGTGAVLLFSDGINTAGPSLSQTERVARSAAIPVISVLVGNEATPPDVKLVDLLLDQEVYFGDQVTLEVSVVASEVVSANVRVTLIDQTNQRVLDELKLQLNQQQRQAVARLSFVPERPGAHPLTIQIEPLAGEVDTSNNKLTTQVNVQDKTLRVLFVQESPDYEFRFLKHFLERSTQVGQQSSSFELSCVLQSADPDYVKQDVSAIRLVPSSSEQLAEFDVFVFGQFDPTLLSRRSQELIRDAIVNQGAGCIFIYGSGNFLRRIQDWPLGTLLPVQTPTFQDQVLAAARTWQPTALGQSSLPMQLSPSESQSKQLWRELPSFTSLGSVGELKLGANVLAQAVADEGTQPLLVTQFAGAGRVALQCTDETYLWTSFRGSDTYHQRYWGQMLRWLSRGKLNQSSQASSITVEPKQARYGQPIRFSVELGGEIAESSLPASVKLTVSNEDGQVERLSLAPTPRSRRTYVASEDALPPGKYRAILFQPSTESAPQAEFIVITPPNEQANLRTDRAAMESLAENSRGRFYRIDEAEGLFDQLPVGNATRLGTLPPISLWNSWWVALIFIALITSEWLLRRRAKML